VERDVEVAAPAPPPARRDAAGSAAAPAPAPAPTSRAAPAPDAKLLERLASAKTDVRAAAVEEIAAGWPSTAPTLDAALRHTSAEVRGEAASLVARPELKDAEALVRKAVSDPDPAVRVLAVRAVRKRSMKDVEPVLARMLLRDAAVAVRLEALRSLEDVGTSACLEAVLEAWRAEPPDAPEDRARRYLRVLRKITLEDSGTKPDAWGPAIERARRREAEAALRPAGK
jgi:HEAT repeat protein